MKSDKQIKAEFKEKFSKKPEEFYPVKVMKEKDFHRNKCVSCGKNFWSKDESRNKCGDAACIGGYKFIGSPGTKKEFNYINSWNEFKKFFEKKDYVTVERKPVVARWREDTYWVGASIYGFQPFVVSGEAKAPSNAVIVPQPSLRFNDIDNVGITGSHYVCFDMLGQLHFEKKNEFNQAKYFEEYFEWITKGMTVPEKELILHEDAWAGGGNFGPCMEFFCKGLEIGNQVYMQFQQTEQGFEELKLKVLDMGQGHERIPWLSTGKAMSYESTFPSVLKYLYKVTGTKYDEKLMKQFLPFSALLNADEAENIELVWDLIAKNIGFDSVELRKKIFIQSAVYSIAEHSRAALIALHDGAIPSNVGGGYNLRSIIRRAFDLNEKNSWNIDFNELFELHSEFLKPLFPELNERVSNSMKIIDSEKKKFLESREKSKRIVSSLINSEVDENLLIELYDSHGISPEFVKQEFEKAGRKITVSENFYGKVNERHQEIVHATATKKEFIKELSGLSETKLLFFDSWKLNEFTAKIVKAFKDLIVLDKTAFYATSGGQEHDTGSINGIKVINVFKQGNVIVHQLEKTVSLKEGTEVKGIIDFERRKQLTQHHTGAHLLNGAAQIILGPHVWQAGAAKTLEKGRLDITHFTALTEEETKKIELKVNDLIQKDIPIYSCVLLREQAEEKHGMRLYQGGFIPGRELRVVEIQGIDVEACGGTHLNKTSELEIFKILNSTRIQDGVIRINFVCGNAAKKLSGDYGLVLDELALVLGGNKFMVPARAQELFDKWKKAKKYFKKKQRLDFSKELQSRDELNLTDEELIKKTCELLSTQPQHIVNTITRFRKELDSF
ncbi:MAG: alanine--tRNA ligase [Candidatus Diapherotrites archaeon]|nr:alanine--tRNA ligase [Candidatus Diapherotrites archaeon]